VKSTLHIADYVALLVSFILFGISGPAQFNLDLSHMDLRLHNCRTYKHISKHKSWKESLK